MAQIGIREVTLGGEVAAALVRSACVGLLALLVAQFLAPFLARITKPFRRGAWLLLLAPFALPTLMIGYYYANVSLRLTHEPWLRELLYGALLWLKLTPVAVVLLHFAPRPLSEQAAHCLRLAKRGGSRSVVSDPDSPQPTELGDDDCSSRRPRRQKPSVCPRTGTTTAQQWTRRSASLQSFFQRLRTEISIWLLANGRASATAFVLVFLFVFADFELSSLLWTDNWTVVIFDAQIGGIPLAESFRWIALPLFVQALLVSALLALLLSQKFEAFQPRSFSVRPSHTLATVSWSYLLLSFIAGAAIPFGALTQQAMKGIPVLAENLGFSGEITSGLIFAAAGASAAYWLAGVLTKRLKTARGSVGLVAACLPGFAGALTLSLCVLALFQLPLLRERFFDAWRLPLAVALLLLPFAVLMRMALRVARPASASRLAELMRAGGGALKQRADEILWRLEKRKHYWAVALLFCWAYYDLTASSLLAPADMPTAMARLYNFTHYGRITGLSALILATILAPVALAFVLAGLRAVWARWRYG